jgi:hypothetical protein
MNDYHLPIENQFYKAREEVLQVIADRYQFLCKSLDKKALELAEKTDAPNWIGAWQQFRTNPDPNLDISAIILQLPSWAQIQFRQISTLGTFISLNNHYIQYLQEEIQYSFQRGLDRGKTLAETDELTQIANNRHYPPYLRNYAREILNQF